MLIYYVDLKPLGLIGLSFIVLLFSPRPLIFPSPRKIKGKKIYSKKEKKNFQESIDESSRATNLTKDIIIIMIKKIARLEKLPPRRSEERTRAGKVRKPGEEISVTTNFPIPNGSTRGKRSSAKDER